MRKFFIAFLVLLLLPVTVSISEEAGESVRAVFLNVGKADSAILLVGDTAILVDAGTKSGGKTVVEACRILGIQQFDAIFFSHMDKDHVGGLKTLLKNGITACTVYAGQYVSDEYAASHPAEKLCRAYSVPLVYLSAGEEISIANVSIQILGPLQKDASDENNNSLIMYVTTTEGSFLFTGDMESAEENDLLLEGVLPRADVLKVAHHGDDVSSGKSFVLAVHPTAAVISTSTEEEPDTPDPKVLSRLREIGADIYITQDYDLGVLLTLTDGAVSAEAFSSQITAD